MRLEIKTEGVRFRAGGPAKQKNDYQDKSKQAMTPDGRPIWLLRLTAFDTNTAQGSSESVWVEVAGDKPELATDELVQITGLVFAPYISGPARKEHRIVRSFRADTSCWPRPAARPRTRPEPCPPYLATRTTEPSPISQPNRRHPR